MTLMMMMMMMKVTSLMTMMTLTVSVEYSSCGWARWALSICCCCICNQHVQDDDHAMMMLMLMIIMVLMFWMMIWFGIFVLISPAASLPAVRGSVQGASSAGLLACQGLASQAACQDGPGSQTPRGSH